MYHILANLWRLKKRGAPSYGTLSLHFCDHSYQIWTAVIRSASLKSVFNKAILLKPLFYSRKVISLSLNPGPEFLLMDSTSLPSFQ